MLHSKSAQGANGPAAECRQTGEIERTILSIVIARDLDSPSHPRSISWETGCLGAVALGTAKLRLGSGDAHLEFIDATGLSASGFFTDVEGVEALRDEVSLIRVLTRLIELSSSPLIVTWNGATDIPYLRFRAFVGDRRANWLLKASLPDTEELVAAHHLDLCRYLFPEGLPMSIEQALLGISIPRDPEIRGLARLEVTACGLLVLAAKAFWFRGEISDGAYSGFVTSVQERARQFSVTRPHFGFLVPDAVATSEKP